MNADPRDRDEENPGRTTPDAVYGSNVQELLRARIEIDRVLKERFEKTVAVLFTDIVGSTSYFHRLGDVEGRAMLMRTNDLLFPVVEATGGRVVKTIGDAIMAFFESPQEAVECAIQMQLKMVAAKAASPANEEAVHIRIGVNYGPAFVEATDVYGDTVNVAARVQAQAVRDQILVSARVKEAVAGDLTVGFSPSASVLLKGKSEPVQLFEVAWRDMTRRQAVADRPKVDARYQIEHLLGTGGMAAVWRAQDQRLGRPVAIKVLHRHLDLTPLARERFRREARTAASLVHDNIVQVFDYESDGSQEAYIAMEMVDGRSLRRYLTGKGPIPDIVAAAIAHEVARGLAHAHTKGVIHRDVKPDNVLLSDQGTVKLGDFGIAGVTEATRLTVTGAAVGSPAYMAPEQLEGLPPAPTNDVFGLGVTLYEMAAGRPPFDGKSPATVLRLVAECKFEHPQKFAPVGEALCTIILKAMARDPKERYADAGVMMGALRNLLDAKGMGDPRAALSRFVLIDDTVQLAAVAATFSVDSTSMASAQSGGNPAQIGSDATHPSVVRERPRTVSKEARVAKPNGPRSRWPLLIAAIVLAAVGGLSIGKYSAYEKSVAAHDAPLLPAVTAPVVPLAVAPGPAPVIAVAPPVPVAPPPAAMAAAPTTAPPALAPVVAPAPKPGPAVAVAPRPPHHVKDREKDYEHATKVASSKEVEATGIGSVRVVVKPYCDHLFFDGQDRGAVHQPLVLQSVRAGNHDVDAKQEAGKLETKGTIAVLPGKTLVVKVDLLAHQITSHPE